MRICFATPVYPRGGTASGVGTAVRTLARQLVKDGHAVTVVALHGTPLPSEQDEGVQVHWVTSGQVHWYTHRIPFIGSLFSLPIREIEYSLALARRVSALHRENNYQVIEGTETGSLFLSQIKPNVSVIIGLHGDEYTFLKHVPGERISFALRLSRTLQRLALRKANLLISPSNAHADEVAREAGVDPTKIRVVPHALDTMWLTLSSEMQRVKRESIVLFVGRLQRGKGILDALYAFERVNEIVPEARLVIVGSIHPSLPVATIEKTIRHLDLVNSIQLVGPQDYKHLAHWYARSQVFVFPSYYESFGLTALEAMSFGLPVIGTCAGALPEVVQDRVNGLLVKPGDIQGLALAILRLLQNESLCQELGEKGERMALESYSGEQLSTRTLDAFKRIRNIPRHEK